MKDIDLGHIGGADRATRASHQAPAGLDHSAGIPCAETLLDKLYRQQGQVFRLWQIAHTVSERRSYDSTLRRIKKEILALEAKARDSDTRPKDGDAQQAPLAGRAAIAQVTASSNNRQTPENT